MKTLSGLWLMGKVAWKANPMATILSLIGVPLALMQALQPVAVGMLVAGAMSQDLGLIIWSAVLLLFATSIGPALQVLSSEAQMKQREMLSEEFDARIALMFGTIPTIDHLVDKDLLDKAENLRANQSSFGEMWNSVIAGLQSWISAVGVLIIAAAVDWRLLVIAAASTVNLLGLYFQKKWNEKADEVSASPGRQVRHLMDLISEPTRGSEIRVFSMQKDIKNRLLGASNGRFQPRLEVSTKSAWLGIFSAAVVGVAVIWVLAAIGIDVRDGKVSLSTAATAVMLVGQLTWLVGGASMMFSWMIRSLQIVRNYQTIEAYQKNVADRFADAEPMPTHLREGIEVKDLSFSYPGSDKQSLQDVSLNIPPGHVVAVVGENGSGKTTLINNIVGLYNRSNDSGEVLIDGTSLFAFNPEDVRSNMTGSFQDYARFEMIAEEEIGLGELSRNCEQNVVVRSAHKAGADEVIATLPQGLETQLGAQWPSGQDLSGGQWQRMSLARGFMRETPLVTILDEPTSALDAQAEHDLFERYISAAQESRARGGITFLVTHRFSTVKQADLVVVMRDGRVSERGTHAELMAAGGHYAEMYELQAGGYQ